MKRNNSFIFYASYYDAIKNLPEEEQGNIYKILVEYAIAQKQPKKLSATAKACFILIKPFLDNSINKYNASVENGKKGGAPKGNANAKKQPKNNPETTQEQPKNNLKTTQHTSEKQPNINKNKNNNINNNINIIQNKTNTINKIKVETTKTTENELNCVDKKQFYYEILKEKLNKLFNNSNIDNKIYGRISTLLEQIEKQTKFTIKGKELETSSVLESLLNLFVGKPEEIISIFEDIFHIIDTSPKVTDKFKYSVSVMYTKATTQQVNTQN